MTTTITPTHSSSSKLHTLPWKNLILSTASALALLSSGEMSFFCRNASVQSRGGARRSNRMASEVGSRLGKKVKIEYFQSYSFTTNVENYNVR